MSLVRRALVGLLLVVATPAWARAPETSLIEARLRVPQELFDGPGGSSAPLGVRLPQGARLLALGESYGGAWLKVLTLERHQGWVPLSRVELVAMDEELSRDYRYVLDQLYRLTARWILDGPLASFGTGPLGPGLSVYLWLNLARNGLLDYRNDQIEVGVGFVGWWGQQLGDIPATRFWEIPIGVQWLFRLGPRGALMLGPRIGFSVMNDPYFDQGQAVPFRGGLHMRYYFDDDWGVSASFLAAARSVLYLSGDFGASFRF